MYKLTTGRSNLTDKVGHAPKRKSSASVSTMLLVLTFMIGTFVCDYGNGNEKVFDSTCGYPGEGLVSDWSRKHPNLTMATWITRSLTFERFYYCQSLGYDVLALTELW